MNDLHAETTNTLTAKQDDVDRRLDELIAIVEQAWCPNLPTGFRVAQIMHWLTDIDYNPEATRLLLATAIDRLRPTATAAQDNADVLADNDTVAAITERAVRAIADDIERGAIKLPCPVRVVATVVELGSGSGVDIDIEGLPDDWVVTTTRTGYFTREAPSEQGLELGRQIVAYFSERQQPYQSYVVVRANNGPSLAYGYF